ncbi:MULTISPECIES: DUF1120 domain-containing protein [Pantoea]|uniref:DUF1120 domain-containing protein n=1 Tax=Pantoea TaxID=53335 RepID=UPI001CC20091|nr:MULTISPECIES: DUF1120 domain-containing protein [Pantoea]
MSLNKVVTALSITGAFLLANPSFAAMDINVHGVIAPNACTASVIGGDSLDWGITQHENLNQTSFNTFPKKQVTLQISCPSAQSVAFWATDPNENSAMVGQNTSTQSGHADSSRIFGLGMDPVTGNKLGNFTITPVSSTVDGVTNSTSFGYQNSGAHDSTAFTRVLNSAWSYKKTEDWTPWDEATGKPASGKSISWVLDIEPQLNKGNQITNAQQVDWQGTAQVNVRYF